MKPERCDCCGRYLAFADLCFSKHNFTPLNEFGPEESSFTGPCCRWRDEPASRQAQTDDLYMQAQWEKQPL